MPCEQFVAFQDDRGVHDGNSKCGCGRLSRLQVAGKSGKVKSRGLHYVCAMGGCGFYAPATDDRGEQYGLSEGLLDMFVQLKLI